MLFGDGDEVFLVGFVVADEGAVGLDDDVVGAAVVDDVALLVPGVELGVGWVCQLEVLGVEWGVEVAMKDAEIGKWK